MPEETRQLAAIMFTDIEGYTALMQQDEKKGIASRKRHREIFNRITEKYKGKILQYYGDGTLSIFGSAIDAVECGIEMQIEFQKDPKVPVRIGIHTGDVVFSETDIIGDGVNVASRVESLAVSGAVFISEKVYDEIKNQPKLPTVSMGYFELKNVEKPIEIYALTNPGLSVPQRAHIDGKTKIPARAKPARSNGWYSKKRIMIGVGILGTLLTGYLLSPYGPNFTKKIPTEVKTEPASEEVPDKSIAVLPLKNLSEEEGSQYFSDGMMDAILSDLSNIGELKVISRTSMEQFRNTSSTIPEIAEALNVENILEGSVQRDGNKIRIIVQLINAREDRHIWSQNYDREITDVFEIQSEIAKQIARELKAELSPQEQERIEKVPTNNLAAYDFYLKGRQYHNEFSFRHNETDLRLAIDFYKKALELDPDFFLARINLGWTFRARVTFLGEEVNLYDSALSLANDLVDHYPNRSELFTFLADIYWQKGFSKVRIKELLIKAVTSNPNDPRALYSLSRYFRTEENRLDLALILIQRASAVEPSQASYHLEEGFAWIQLNDLKQAEKSHLNALSIQPGHVLAYTNLGLVYILQEDNKRALSVLQKALSFNSQDLYLNHQIAFAYSLQGEFERSEQYFLKVKKVVEREDYAQNRSTGWFPARYAYTLWSLGKKEKAKKYFEEEVARDLLFIEENVANIDGDTYYELVASLAFLGNKEDVYYWLNKMLENKRWVPAKWFLNDPLFNELQGDERLKKYIEASTSGLEGLRKSYEELKTLPFADVIKRFSQPLEIPAPEKI